MNPINTSSSLSSTSNLSGTSSDSVNDINNVVSTLASSVNTAQPASQATSSLPQPLLDSFFNGLSSIQNVTPQTVAVYLQQFSQQQGSQHNPVSVAQQQTLLQSSMSTLEQQGDKGSPLYQAANQTLMGTFSMQMMVNKYMHDVFNSLNKDKNDDDSGW